MTEALDWALFAQKVGEFLGRDPSRLLAETNIYDDLGLDSLGIFSLGMHLIKQFGIRLPLSEVAEIATIGDMYAALDRHRPTTE